jgi:hypothetical protein
MRFTTSERRSAGRAMMMSEYARAAAGCQTLAAQARLRDHSTVGKLATSPAIESRL